MTVLFMRLLATSPTIVLRIPLSIIPFPSRGLRRGRNLLAKNGLHPCQIPAHLNQPLRVFQLPGGVLEFQVE